MSLNWAKERRQKGIASLEFVVLFPLFLTLILIFFDIAKMHWQYSMLDSAMRGTLRALITENWLDRNLTLGVVTREIKERSEGLIELSEVSSRRFDSLQDMLNAETVEDEIEEEFRRPTAPVFRIEATINVRFTLSPLAWFIDEEFTYSSILILNPELILN
ncbi:pilus assembly protein [Vibrio sp. S9_S30]|uniref:TadE/TadG family type IV pilus assembly protein n=1 Tax=Vibrio sp. S9_S30 TaxID=2720226 RepID=UPI00168051D4|nr:TadE family protein [Vibrio sp. S9_S30]MBD1556166.1 pilus assembly protein [Vibrio sp. S9_S30]